MIRYKQTILHDPANGLFGDCWRTCLGCLLHIEPAQVPHFGSMGDRWFKETQAWLGAHFGLAVFELPFMEIFPHIEVKGVYGILTGISPRNPEVRHSVIGLDGAIEHDPHPDNGGLARGPEYMALLVRMNNAPIRC